MKITCPNCQKEYTLSQAKLPQGVETAKCKACGYLISLKEVSVEASTKPVGIVKIACKYCGQSHSLQQDKIPPSAKSIKCKSCGHLIPFIRARSSASVHALKKKLSASAPDQTTAEPVELSAGKNDIIRFRCAGCGKKYKIGREKIPPNVMAVNCRACGYKNQLPRTAVFDTADDRHQPTVYQDKTPPPKLDLMTPAMMPSVSRPRKKKWLFAAFTCVLLVAILGTLANLNIIKLDWLSQFIPEATEKTTGAAEKTAESPKLLVQEPFLVLNLNAPLIFDAFENRLASNPKTVQLQTMISMMKSMDLNQLELYLYDDPNRQILPVILAHGSNQRQLENIFNSQEPFKNYFKRNSDGSYRLKKEAISDAEKYKLPREPYQVTLIDKGVLLAPVSFSSAIKENPQLLTNAPVAKFAQTIATRQDITSIAIRVPEGIRPGWEKKIQNHPAVQATAQTAMIANMGATIMSQLTGALKSVDVMALGFRFTGQKGRTLSYTQQFRRGVDGEKIYQQLATTDLANTNVDGIISKLIEFLQDQRYQHTLDFKDNRLSLEFSWSEKEDEAFLTALTAAAIGQFAANSVELSPTPGEVATRYATEPHIVTTVDTDQLKAKIPEIIKDSLFPGHYWNMGDKPRMTLDLDTINLPNAALAELTYEVKSIQSPSGREVLRVEENKIKPRIQPGSLFPGNISLSVKEGTAPDDLGRASIFFYLTVPVALEVFDFAVGDPPGSAKDAAGILVTLGQLEKDVAQVSSSGGKSMRLVAYDQTGKVLATKESMGSPSSIATRFEGIISTLKVVVTREMLEYPFGLDVDLNEGKELVLSREPEIPARTRFNPHPIPIYVNFTTEDLKNLVVEWTEGQEGSWNDSLSIKLPQGPCSGHAIWEVHFFGHNKPRLLAGGSAQGSKDFSFTLEKGKLKQANAAFGKVQLNLHTDIARLVFAKKDNRQPVPQVLSTGDKVLVEFNKNEIIWSAGNADVIQTIAYDARGIRLKQDQYTRNQGGKRAVYFWGIPAKFEVDVSTKTLKKLIPFDIKQRPLDESAYLAFKLAIKNQRDVVNTIKAIDRARRKDRSYYGDDLAGLYYLYDSKQNTPLKLISQEIAHSDPAGQNRFSYKAKPYKGYYFTVLSGAETNGVNKDYSRRSKESRFVWQEGTIITASLTRHPDLVAIPEDSTQPTFFLQWGQVFMKRLNGERLKYLPDGYYNKGWVEAKYVDG